MTIFYIFTAIILLAPIAGVWPLHDCRHSGQGASNNPWWISMPPRAAYDGDALHWKAVFAEELVEHWTRWAVALVVVHVGLLAVPHDHSPLTALVTCFVAYVGNLWTALSMGERMIEYVGKASFSIVKGVPVDSEAAFLRQFYPEAFADTTVEQARRGLRRAAPVARVLVKLFTARLRRVGV